MFENLRHLLGGSVTTRALATIQKWSPSHGGHFLRVRHATGCVVEGRWAEHQPWRLEWGEPQRAFIDGPELRLYSDAAVAPDLQAMLLSRDLIPRMEKAVYDQYVDDVRTRIDGHTPPEMRWLVLHTRLTPTELGPLCLRWGAVCSQKSWMQDWLVAPMADALQATTDVLGDAPSVVLTAARGRLALRCALAEPADAVLDAMIHLLKTAVEHLPHPR